MALPTNSDKSNPRKHIVLLVRCFKDDYKAQSCTCRPCEECSVGNSVSNFEPIDVRPIKDETLVQRVINFVARLEKKARKKRVPRKKR